MELMPACCKSEFHEFYIFLKQFLKCSKLLCSRKRKKYIKSIWCLKVRGNFTEYPPSLWEYFNLITPSDVLLCRFCLKLVPSTNCLFENKIMLPAFKSPVLVKRERRKGEEVFILNPLQPRQPCTVVIPTFMLNTQK